MREIRLTEILSEIPELGAGIFSIKANGASMFPTIVKGDEVTIDGKRNNPQVGEIILAQDEQGSLIVHRVVATQPKLSTKGDNVSSHIEESVTALGVVIEIKRNFRSQIRRVWIHAKNIFS